MNILNHVFLKAFMMAIIFTIFFLGMTYFEKFMDDRGITGTQKIYVTVPVQFTMIMVVYIAVMYAFALFFKLRL